MRLLIAEDDAVTRRILEVVVKGWGYEPVPAADGLQAWDILSGECPPPMALLDLEMPEVDGAEICRRVRGDAALQPTYVLILTGHSGTQHIVAGLEAGADDYLVKPPDHDELRARLQVGRRIVELQLALAGRVRELQEALAEVSQLRGILPICAYCKKVRNDQNYWQKVESYVAERSEAQFSHGICPECWESVVVPQLDELDDPQVRS